MWSVGPLSPPACHSTLCTALPVWVPEGDLVPDKGLQRVMSILAGVCPLVMAVCELLGSLCPAMAGWLL